MKIRTVSRPFLLFYPLLLLFSSFTHAVVISDSSVTLTLDWSSLDSYVVWNPANYKNNGASANLDGVVDTDNQWDDPTVQVWVGDPTVSYTAQVTADAIGSANTTIDSANATAHARADGIGTSSPPDENVSASGTSHRGKVFSPIEDGFITFSFDYIISQTFIKDFSTENYSSWSIAELYMSDSSAGGAIIAEDEFILNNAGTTENGTLGFTLDLLSSHFYYIEGHVYTASSANSPEQETPGIPEPATLALMGLGLAGIGYRRKKAV